MRTPYVGDGYFQDEMGELYEYTVEEGEFVNVDDTARAGVRGRGGGGGGAPSPLPPSSKTERPTRAAQVAVVDTHKASVDIRSPVAGTVSRFLVEPGEEVYETHPILTLYAKQTNSPRVRMKEQRD